MFERYNFKIGKIFIKKVQNWKISKISKLLILKIKEFDILQSRKFEKHCRMHIFDWKHEYEINLCMHKWGLIRQAVI